MKKLLLTLLTLMATIAVNAGQVSRQQALQKALKFMPNKQFGETKAYARSESSSDTEPFYIFNVVNNGGFVIVSGDDRMKSILGYAEHGNFDLNDMPENVRWWLGQYEKAILSLNNTTPAPIVKRSATRGTSEAKEDIAPFITTYWGQHAPYNSQCPTYNNENCITGCIATAMAQVMNYTKWPESATSEIASYTTETLSLSVPKLSATTFNWDSMADDDIARLMRYCGQAVGMDYGLESSGAYDARIPGALIGKFGYDNGIRIIYRNGYNSETWEGMIYNELKAGRPVIYGGQSGKGGHSFICHGYREGMFYINWGWNGNWDGYFALTALNPDGTGSYGKDQTAVIGIQKPTGGAIVSNPMVTVTKVELTSDETVSRASSSANFTDIAIKSTLQHAFMEDKTVHVGFVLYQGDVLKQVLSSGSIAFSPGLNVTFNATLSFGSGLADGTYRIVPVYRESEASDWIADEGSVFRYVEAIVEGTNLKLKVMPDAAHDERLKYNVILDGEVEVAASSEDIEGDIVIPATVEVDGKLYKVTAIAHSGFMNCQNMTSIKMPSGIKDFGWGCFKYCKKIKEITIPRDLRGSYGFVGIFNGCDNLVEIKIEEGNTNFIVLDGALLTADGTGMIDYAAGLDIKDYVMPETVEWMQGNVFAENKHIETVKLSPKLTAIEYGTFYRCTALKTVYLPKGLKSINGGAFQNSSLSEIDLPSELKNIEEFAFAYCNKLKQLTIPQSITEIKDYAFQGCFELQKIFFKKASPIAISNNVFEGMGFLEDGTGVDEDYIFKTAILYVPIGRSGYFNQAEVWRNFVQIEEMDMPEVIISDNPFENIDQNQMILGYYRGEECLEPGYNGLGGEFSGEYMAVIGYSKENLAPFMGSKIKAVRFALTNTNIKHPIIWLGSARDKHDILEKKVEEIKTGWNVINLGEECQINCDSLFIGLKYDSEISSNYPISYYSLSSFYCESGCAYMYGPYDKDGDNMWIDASGSGCLSIQCLIEGDNIPMYDIHVANKELWEFQPTRYFKQDESTPFSVHVSIKDWGKYSIGNDYELSGSVDNTPVEEFGRQQQLLSHNPTDPWSVYGNIPSDLSIGEHNLSISLKSIKGETPKYPQDDVATLKMKVYSKDMGRQKQLLQVYTATWCPDGIYTMQEADRIRNENPNLVRIDFYTGDELTCPASEEYYRLSDWVGIISYNRYMGYGYHYLTSNRQEVLAQPSFADVYISCGYDEKTRMLKILVKGSRNEEFVPIIGSTNLTVFLTEDDVIAPQYDSSNSTWITDYKHQGVLRTNVSAVWGDPVVWNGDEYVMHYTIHLNEEWNKDKMHVVAFLGKPFDGSNFTDIDIVNCNDFDVKDATAIFVEDDVAYKKQDDNSAAISDNGNAKVVVIIPATVTHEGIEYPVKSIGEEAFNGNKNLTLICIPESIEQIGKNAFAGCSNLKAIYSYNENPIALSSDKATVRTRANGEEKSASTVFDGVDKELCILYVPKNSSSKYRSAEGWGEFQNIVEMVSTISGDTNNDGKVNSEDISAISDYITEGKTKAFLFMNANVNNDKKVDVADIVLLVNKIKPAQP